MHRGLRHIALAALIIFAGISCSTVRVLQDNQRRLTSTKISVLNDKKFSSDDLVPYLKQKANGWNPFLYVYNWENGEGRGWDKFVHKLGTEPVVFDSTLVGSSVTNLEDHLKYIGYYDSKVNAVVDSSRYRKASVKYSITLGKQYPIGDISFSVPAYDGGFYRDFNADTVNSLVRKGAFLSESLLEQESARGALAMNEKGYFDFSKNYYFFEADTTSVPGKALLKVIVRPHTRSESDDVVRVMSKYKIGRVSVSYPEDVKFRDKVFRNLNMLHSGDDYSSSKIQTQYSRYKSIGYFNSVNMELSPREDDGLVDCDVQLKKGKTQGFKLGLEATINTSGLWGISPQISYFHKNIFHGGEVLNISVNTNHQMMHKNSSIRSNEVNASASLTFPKFFPFPTTWFVGPYIPKTDVSLSYNFQSRPEYSRHIASASFGYVGQYGDRFSYQAYPVAFNYTYLPFIDPDFMESLQGTNQSILNSFNNHMDLGVSSSFLYSTSSNLSNPKESYWYARFKFDLSGNLFSAFNRFMDCVDGIYYMNNVPYSQYIRLEAELCKSFVWGDNGAHSLAGRFLVGYGKGYGNSVVMPFEKRFYSGGANSLRGWVARTVGPGNGQMNKQWVIPNQTGDMKLEANLEYRFKIFWKINGAAFMDAGNVWEVGEPISQKDADQYFSFKNLGESLAVSWGVGLRVDFTYLLLRLDYGMRLHDPARMEGDRWLSPAEWFYNENHAFHFGVGYPF